MNPILQSVLQREPGQPDPFRSPEAMGSILSQMNQQQPQQMPMAPPPKRDLAREKFERSVYKENRDFADKRAGPFMKQIDEQREALRLQQEALGNMKSSVLNMTGGMMSQDAIAEMFGSMGEGLLTPEGTLNKTATKEFLIGSLKGIGGRPNQFLEQQISTALTKIGRSKEANLMIVAAFERALRMKEAKISTADAIAQNYREQGLFTPENISELVDKNAQPLYRKIERESDYTMQHIREMGKNLYSQTTKSVPKGTMLTMEMARDMQKKYGPNAEKAAKKLGYTIPTEQEILEFMDDE